MSRIIETTETAFLIESMLANSKDIFIIVCPFFQVHERMKRIMVDKLSDPDFELHIVTRQTGKDKIPWLNSSNVYISIIDNLHAKYYYNGQAAIISSMNLYEYSQVNNIEVGVYFTRDDEEQFSFFIQHYWRISTFDMKDYFRRQVKKIKLTKEEIDNVG
jgi:hypothetical protein